jgi:hypothetical protein
VNKELDGMIGDRQQDHDG